jgi:hypothetical protein
MLLCVTQETSPVSPVLQDSDSRLEAGFYDTVFMVFMVFRVYDLWFL